MPRRRYQSPDGLDWRDPEMPVLGKSGREIDHNKLHRLAEERVEHAGDPKWRHDPTYNLRKSKHKDFI